MEDDYTQYLLVRNFSKNPADKLSDAYLKYLFLLYKSIPEQRFQELAKIAKNTLKLRKQLGEVEQERQRLAEQYEFKLRDLEIENLQNPMKADYSELKANQARIKLLETQLYEAERLINDYKRQLQKCYAENAYLQNYMQYTQAEDLAQLYEDEKQNSFYLQQQIFYLNRELNQYKEFYEKLYGYCPERGSFGYTLKYVSDALNAGTIRKNAVQHIHADIRVLKEQVYTMKAFCRVGIDLSEILPAIRKALVQARVAGSISMTPPQRSPAHMRVFLKTNSNQPAAVYDRVIPCQEFVYFVSLLIVNILTAPKAFEFNQNSALQDVLNVIRHIAFYPCVMSALAMVESHFVDGVAPYTRVESVSQALKIEVNQSSELPKVVSLIYKKSVGSSGLALCFYQNNYVGSVICCGIPLQKITQIGIQPRFIYMCQFDQ